MADVGTAIRGFLAADSGVSALVGTRIYPDDLPQQGATLPAITYYRIDTNHFNTLQGTKSGIAQARIPIDCFAATRTGANALSEAVRLSGILDLRGVVNGVDVRDVSIASGQSHHTEDPNDGTHEKRFVTRQEYAVFFKEEV